eukprot:scaffold61730_cov34-Tisochrysis_lutea.AAC.2
MHALLFVCVRRVATQDLLSKTAMLKLNGGLGTSMGLEKAKSLLVVKEGKTFLDLIAEQVWLEMRACECVGVEGVGRVKHMRATYGSKVAFTLMDSFSTSADTRAFLQQRHGDLLQELYAIVFLVLLAPALTLSPVSVVLHAALHRAHADVRNGTCMQNMSPKVDANTLGPASYPENPGGKLKF